MHLQRQRYLLFEYKLFAPISVLTEKDIIRTIWKSLTNLFGDYIAYKTGLWMVEFDSISQYGILRCNNITKERVMASLAFIQEINDSPIVFHTIMTSGTIKKSKEIQKQYFEKHRK